MSPHVTSPISSYRTQMFWDKIKRIHSYSDRHSVVVNLLTKIRSTHWKDQQDNPKVREGSSSPSIFFIKLTNLIFLVKLTDLTQWVCWACAWMQKHKRSVMQYKREIGFYTVRKNHIHPQQESIHSHLDSINFFLTPTKKPRYNDKNTFDTQPGPLQ